MPDVLADRQGHAHQGRQCVVGCLQLADPLDEQQNPC